MLNDKLKNIPPHNMGGGEEAVFWNYPVNMNNMETDIKYDDLIENTFNYLFTTFTEETNINNVVYKIITETDVIFEQNFRPKPKMAWVVEKKKEWENKNMWKDIFKDYIAKNLKLIMLNYYKI